MRPLQQSKMEAKAARYRSLSLSLSLAVCVRLFLSRRCCQMQWMQLFIYVSGNDILHSALD